MLPEIMVCFLISQCRALSKRLALAEKSKEVLTEEMKVASQNISRLQVSFVLPTQYVFSLKVLRLKISISFLKWWHLTSRYNIFLTILFLAYFQVTAHLWQARSGCIICFSSLILIINSFVVSSSLNHTYLSIVLPFSLPPSW